MKRYLVNNSIKIWILPILLVVIGLCLFGKDLLNEDIFYPDADRVAMDGIYFHDLLKDMPLWNIYNYTIYYYAKYPALSVGYRESLFPLILGILYHIFGISMVTAKLGILVFAAVGIVFFYRLVQSVYDTKVAILATLLYITTPNILYWARIPMLEIPAITMCIISIYYFYKYTELNSRNALGIFFVVFALALLMKKHTVFLFPFLVIYLIVRRKSRLFLKKEAFLWFALFAIIILPYLITARHSPGFSLGNVKGCEAEPASEASFSWRS